MGNRSDGVPAGVLHRQDDWYPETLREWKDDVDLLAEQDSCDGMISFYNAHFGGDRADEDLYNYWWEQVNRVCDELGCEPDEFQCEAVEDRLNPVLPPGCSPSREVPHCKNWPWG